MSVKSACIKCEFRNNSNGLFNCNGCQQNLCSKHTNDHINELRNRFEEITNEYNVVKDLFNDYKRKSNGSHWELIYYIRKELNEIKYEIDQYQKTSNYSEQELDQWRQRLDKLKIQLRKIDEASSSIVEFDQFLSSKRFLTYLILRIILLILLACYINYSFKLNLSFTEVNGPIELSDDKCTVEYIGSNFVEGSVRINRIYSKDIHHVRLKFEQIFPSKIFIRTINEQSFFLSSFSSYGWSIEDNTVIDQNPEEFQIFKMLRKFWSLFTNNLPRLDIQTGDILDIQLDCINSEITLKNLRTDKNNTLNIDLNQTPLPWQIFLYLYHYGDRVRVL